MSKAEVCLHLQQMTAPHMHARVTNDSAQDFDAGTPTIPKHPILVNRSTRARTNLRTRMSRSDLPTQLQLEVCV
jgi:hypothetical protein